MRKADQDLLQRCECYLAHRRVRHAIFCWQTCLLNLAHDMETFPVAIHQDLGTCKQVERPTSNNWVDITDSEVIVL